MPSTAKKRVFILGAGFSKPAGFPLATEMTDEVLDALRASVGDGFELFDFARHIRQLHRWITRSKTLSLLNIEEFYEYASVYAERFRSEQHGEPVGRSAGDTAYGQAEALETWLQYLDEYLLDVLLAHEDAAELTPVDRLAGLLQPGDAVVTFNYDRLIERSLASRSVPWSFGLDTKASSEAVPVLKVHGSLDWICFARSERCDRRGIRLLFSKTDENRRREKNGNDPCGEDEYDLELFHIHDDTTLHHFIDERDLIQGFHRWGLAGLGPQKRVSQIPGLGIVWQRARQELYQADQIVVVGFSFSGYDRLAQIEFARVMAGRDENGVAPPRITVIDPALRLDAGQFSDGGRALIQRIESVFRPAIPVGLLHEEFDWATLG